MTAAGRSVTRRRGSAASPVAASLTRHDTSETTWLTNISFVILMIIFMFTFLFLFYGYLYFYTFIFLVCLVFFFFFFTFFCIFI